MSATVRGATPPTTTVLAVTVTYRSAAWVARSLAALALERQRCPNLDLRCTVVDNASGDAPQLEQLVLDEGWSNWVTILRAERNGGFAYGNNVAIRHAYDNGAVPDFFFLLNPDTEVRPNAISALTDFLVSEPRAGIAASLLESPDGTPWPYAFRFPTLWSEVDEALGLGALTRLLGERTILHRMGETPARIEWASGSALMVRREVIEELGGMDESYFLYFEETDYFMSLLRSGWSAWFVPQSRVMHAAGQSTGVRNAKGTEEDIDKRQRPPRLPDYWFESRRRYFAKNHGLLYGAATDLSYLTFLALGQAKRMLQGRTWEQPPHLWFDVLRHSVLLPKNRVVAAPHNFRPNATGAPQRSAKRAEEPAAESTTANVLG